MKTSIIFKIMTFAILLIVGFLFVGCSKGKLSDLQSKITSLETKLKEYEEGEALINRRLLAFDSLDYDFYTNQKWDEFGHSHAEDILVYYPDGTTTKGLAPAHIDALKPMFTFAPDTRIENHPVRFGQGDWTAVIGILEGTFTEPMPVGNGNVIPPTGKKFKLKMATIGHWKDNKMIEEYLFWDNQSFLKQIGLAD